MPFDQRPKMTNLHDPNYADWRVPIPKQAGIGSTFWDYFNKLQLLLNGPNPATAALVMTLLGTGGGYLTAKLTRAITGRKNDPLLWSIIGGLGLGIPTFLWSTGGNLSPSNWFTPNPSQEAWLQQQKDLAWQNSLANQQTGVQ